MPHHWRGTFFCIGLIFFYNFDSGGNFGAVFVQQFLTNLFSVPFLASSEDGAFAIPRLRTKTCKCSDIQHHGNAPVIDPGIVEALESGTEGALNVH